MRYLPRLTVAVQHYLQVTEDHFKQAAKNATQNSTHRVHMSAGISSNLQRVIDAWPDPSTDRHTSFATGSRSARSPQASYTSAGPSVLSPVQPPHPKVLR